MGIWGSIISEFSVWLFETVYTNRFIIITHLNFYHFMLFFYSIYYKIGISYFKHLINLLK